MQFCRLMPKEPIVYTVPRLNNTKMDEIRERKRAKLQPAA
jgi:hypothetical protein